jgi:hypothetical protein
MKSAKGYMLASAAAFVVAGCANMSAVSNAPLGSGISSSFNSSYDHTNAATLKALSSLNINITSSKEDATGTIYLVSKPMSAFSYGEVGRVYVKKSGSPPILVFVNWEKRDQLQITGTDSTEFSQELFARIYQDL